MDLKDGLTVVALAASLFAVFRSYRLDKRDLFLRMHTELLDQVPMAGRRALRQIESADDAAHFANDPDGQTQVYRALALFDVLDLYVERGWDDRLRCHSSTAALAVPGRGSRVHDRERRGGVAPRR